MRWLIVMPYARPGAMGIDFAEELRSLGHVVETFAYRVVSVRAYPKSELPADVYSVRGPPRLVLVTCGGPFDRAARHYRDNIVVTAVPRSP